MKNKGLAKDYLERAGKRLFALQTLFEQEAWADVVRESQEIVELVLKSLLRHAGIEIPRIHDVGQILLDQKALLPKSIQPHLQKLAEISRELRRDRELAFYGAEDLTPSEFYGKDDAKSAQDMAKWAVAQVQKYSK